MFSFVQAHLKASDVAQHLNDICNTGVGVLEGENEVFVLEYQRSEHVTPL
jgi:hypothetical protein